MSGKARPHAIDEFLGMAAVRSGDRVRSERDLYIMFAAFRLSPEPGSLVDNRRLESATIEPVGQSRTCNSGAGYQYPHCRYLAKVLQADILPESRPALNHFCRLADDPWVKFSGLT